jgi:hypothetical protein
MGPDNTYHRVEKLPTLAKLTCVEGTFHPAPTWECAKAQQCSPDPNLIQGYREADDLCEEGNNISHLEACHPLCPQNYTVWFGYDFVNLTEITCLNGSFFPTSKWQCLEVLPRGMGLDRDHLIIGIFVIRK